MPTLSVSPVDGGQQLPLSTSLSSTATRLYEALRGAAHAVAAHRGYHPAVTVVTLFAPVEAVAQAIGVSRQTIYNRLPELVQVGLVAQRGHFTTYRGQTRADGSLWAVRLNPSNSCAPVRIEHDYLKGHYRDLGADIASGRTAWAALQSKANKGKSNWFDSILTFAIPPLKNSNTDDCKANDMPGLEVLLDVPHAPPRARNEMVDRAAQTVGATLGTSAGSLNMWRWLIWALLRLQEAQGRDYFYQVYLMIQRAGIDRREGVCRNAGGLLVSRLKASHIWDDLRAAPHIRIGRAPPTKVLGRVEEAHGWL